jgi:hypothetical protein
MRTRGIETLTFWFMTLLGAVTVVPCLILPPWLEYKALLEQRRAADVYVATMQYRLRATEKQIEHQQDDPAYVLRLAQQEFGASIGMPNTETVLVDPSPELDDGQPPPEVAANTAQPPEEIMPELSLVLEEVLQRYPYARLFVSPITRRVLLGLGGIMLLTAVVLLGRAGMAEARAKAEQA